ncbi:M20/M25/M40 family metallo-hydrolase [bacterium]|nr:M20/M25/M40 family metallo-hydrolase [bacterium]
MDEWRELGERVLALAERLVAQPSVVDTEGEDKLAGMLAAYLQERLADNPSVVLELVDVPKQPPCRAILAYLPAPIETARTLLLMGHFDTVEVRREESGLRTAEPGDWAFGRGWLDMKGGVAAIVEVFLREAQLRELPAHLVLLLTSDEESASRGIRALVPKLIALKEQHGLDFTRVINADYTAPLHPGDDKRYLYSGTVGKLLLGLSVFGRATHVGEPFSGINATALAGFLAAGLEHNRKLMAQAGGEWLPPPTVLHLRDRRERYDVMTVDCAELYVNIFHVGEDARKLWRNILQEVRKLARAFDRQVRLRYNRISARANVRMPRYTGRAEVIDYAALLSRFRAHLGDEAAPVLAQLQLEAKEKFGGEREQAFYIIRGLHAQLPPGRPLITASLLPPFYPAQLTAKDDPAAPAIHELCSESGLQHRRVYPYIADLSYFSFISGAHLDTWGTQSPLWFGEDELAQYKAVAAPVLNLGPWGIGAHTAEERVYLPYLRDDLPRLLSDALYRLARAE